MKHVYQSGHVKSAVLSDIRIKDDFEENAEYNKNITMPIPIKLP